MSGTRRSRTGFYGFCVALACALSSAILAPARSFAQDVSGALGGHVLIADGDVGGALLLDVWAALDWLRIGGFVGAGAIPSERDASNRVLMPFGISVAAQVLTTEYVTLQIRARGGLWAGSTQSEKLSFGGMFGGGAYLGIVLGHGALLNFGADVWGIIASDAWRTPMGPDDATSASTWVIAPGLGFSWTPELRE